VNCVRTAPWVREAAERYAGKGLLTLGVHAPEFAYERMAAAVAEHAGQLGLRFPNLLDPDFSYWRALGNEYWPTVYLVDRCGRIRTRQVGEVHSGQPSGERLERELQALLAETACGR
jgi:hypothetical protein